MHRSPIRVVLADDHPVVRQGIRQFLEEAGDIQVVAEAAEGDEALRLVQQLLPDVAVLDLRMPNRSGLDIAQAIRDQALPVAILILSAYDDLPYVMMAVEIGVNGYLLKTADADDLVATVRTLCEGKGALDPALMFKLIQGPPSQAAARPPALTARQLDILRELVRGKSNREIGFSLGISTRTVQGHLRVIFRKLDVSSRTEVAMKAIQFGLGPSEPASK